MSTRLLTPEFFEQLEYLNLAVRRILAGERKAEHLSLQSGGTVEFADHRSYTPGDDLRYLDWNVFARHGELFIKEFAAEEDAHVLLMLDCSRSMDFGSPNRFDVARELCAALTYITLSQFDTCSVLALTQKPSFLLRRVRGKKQIYPLLERLDERKATAREAFKNTRILSAIRSGQNTTVILISDFYDNELIRTYLQKLRALHLDTYSIHLMTPQEIDPDLEGTTQLIDQETGEELQLDVDHQTLEAYHRALQEYLKNIQSLALRYGNGYARMSTTTSLVQGVVRLLQKHQILH